MRQLSEDLYQQAKAVFADLVELSDDVRSTRLHELQHKSPELAEEVRSLLDYHTHQSLVVTPPSSGPKIRTRSTLSTTYQTHSWRWIVAPLRALAAGVPFLIAGVLLIQWLDHRVQTELESSVAQYLSDTISHRVADFQQWESERLSEAEVWSQHPGITAPINALVKLAREHKTDSGELLEALQNAKHGQELRRQLQLLVGTEDVKYAVWDRRMVTLCDWNQHEQPTILGKFVTVNGAAMLTPVLTGQPRVYFPRLGSVVTDGYEMETKAPVLSVIVPIRENGAVNAALLIRGYGLEEKYSRMVEEWSDGLQGEVYLINSRCVMMTKSRYQPLLDRLFSEPNSLRKAHYVHDPGVDLACETPDTARAVWPPTVMANQLSKGRNGINVDGYRNYVGRRVVGAWHWLPEHEIGIALEKEYDDAFRIADLFRSGMAWISGLFGLGFLGTIIATTITSARRKKLIDLKDVGPYQVQELLGEGGMGRVYLAEHALLCRQSAVKVLTHGNDDLSVIGRFEREVQLASQLTHPNTISIYDFGRNRDGYFYYAMEYINGGHLGQLIEFSGPIPPGRCIYILRQLCHALNEAHLAGVVHRDIKPQNIMVCNRGGEPDFLKLFDYGLVKSFAPGVSHSPSQTKIVVGTPRFMAPERLNSPWLADPRVDIYSVGALAYYLLTAQLPPLVTLEAGIDHQQTGVETLDLPPDVVEFGEILSVCMAVEPAARPSNMSSLIRELEDLSRKFPWNRNDSLQWWTQNEAEFLHLVKNRRKKLHPRDPK